MVFNQQVCRDRLEEHLHSVPDLENTCSCRNNSWPPAKFVRRSLFQHQVELAFIAEAPAPPGPTVGSLEKFYPTSNSQRAAAIAEEVANEPLDYLSDDDR